MNAFRQRLPSSRSLGLTRGSERKQQQLCEQESLLAQLESNFAPKDLLNPTPSKTFFPHPHSSLEPFELDLPLAHLLSALPPVGGFLRQSGTKKKHHLWVNSNPNNDNNNIASARGFFPG